MHETELARRAEELADTGDWGAEALEVNLELVELRPEEPVARYRLARCLEEAGDLPAARTAFARFLERRDRGLEARIARRRVALLDERARAVATSSPHEALARGRKRAKEGDLDRALVWFERAVETARTPGERAQALTGQTAVLRVERRLRDALAVAERAVAAHPSRRDNMPAYAALAALLADLGRLDEARAEAEALLEARPRNRIVCATAGRVYADLFARTGDGRHRTRADRLFAEARRGR